MDEERYLKLDEIQAEAHEMTTIGYEIDSHILRRLIAEYLTIEGYTFPAIYGLEQLSSILLTHAIKLNKINLGHLIRLREA